MTKEIWINLPVRDVDKTKKFFENIGFTLNAKQTNEKMACFAVGEKKMTVLFFAEEIFKRFTKIELADARATSEVLISFDAESRAAVDETASRVFEAGGTIFSAPSEIEGRMYGFGFADLDGHRWNMLYMDHGTMPD